MSSSVGEEGYERRLGAKHTFRIVCCTRWKNGSGIYLAYVFHMSFSTVITVCRIQTISKIFTLHATIDITVHPVHKIECFKNR